jgi:integrase
VTKSTTRGGRPSEKVSPSESVVRRAYQPNAGPDTILRSLPIGTPDWRRVLAAVLKLHNYRHAAKDKNVSGETSVDRSRFYYSFFAELNNKTKYFADPRQLAGRHVELMVERWLDRHLATATIHNYLSFLRTFSGWIGKPGMVLPPGHYVGEDSIHAHRHQIATEDHSWSARGIDAEKKIAEVSAVDHWVGLQLEICFRFGARPKEARFLRPHSALVQRDMASPRDAIAYPEAEEFVRFVCGTKGGRLRDVPLLNAEQRALIKRLQQAVTPGGYVGRPGRTAEQNQTRFYYVVRKCGISKAALGVVAHGLRHQAANDRFELDAGGPSPVRGGRVTPPNGAEARHRVSRLLGHSRLRAAAFYVGSLKTSAANDDDVGGPEPDQAGEGEDECSPD